MDSVFAGVDLGGTGIKVVLGKRDGTIIEEGHVPTDSHEGAQAVIQRIGDLVERLATKHNTKPAAIGMGVPGLVDVKAGITKFLPNFPTHWRDVPAGPMLSDRFGCPVRLLNDVRTATVGELTFGHGAREPKITMVFFAIGTGIGGGIVIDGRLRLGPLGAAGEIGHQTMLPDGPLCGCGNHGCLEALVSGPALAFEAARLMRIGQAPQLRKIVHGHMDRISTREMVAAAEAGDEAIRDCILRASGYLGIAVATMITALHPDLVVLGGGVAEIGPMLFNKVREVVKSRVRMLPTDGVRIERSLLGDKAGELGALALASRDDVI